MTARALSAQFDDMLVRLLIKRLPPLQRSLLLTLPEDGSPGPVQGFRPKVSAACLREVRVHAGTKVALVEPAPGRQTLARDKPEIHRLTDMGRKVAAAIRAGATA